MKEKTWTLANPDALGKSGMFLRIDVDKGPCELWPLALRHSKEDPVSFVISSRADGLIDVYRGEQLSLEALPILLVVMDSTIQISMPDDANAVCLLYDGTNLVEGAIVDKKGTYVSSMVDPKYYRAQASRAALKILCHSPSQLSIDMHFDKEGAAHTGIAIEHRDGYANVWRDVYRSGAWVSNLREKLGYFTYTNTPYTLSIAMVVDEDGQARARVCVSSDGKFKAFPAVDCEGASFDWVSVRESYCTGPQPGQFDVESLVI